MAAPLLVLWTSRGLYRRSAGHGNGFGYSFDVLQKTDLQLSNDGLFDGGHRRTELCRLGPPYVRQRNESLPGFGVHTDDVTDRSAFSGKNVQLVGYGVGCANTLHTRSLVRHRLRVYVCERRVERYLSGNLGGGYPTARHLFRSCPFPSGDGNRTAVRCIRWPLLLVSEDVWPLHEQHSRKDSLLVHFHRGVLRLLSDAHYW